ncbi:MAG: hypothetical protein HY271_09590 [Deltaproteobacteria bacterium]|nr:hypothetical protein [Deltaproteobacteria bacterium]
MCIWFAIGAPCTPGAECLSGVCQRAGRGGGGGDGGCVCACPACVPSESCPPCDCDCSGGMGVSGCAVVMGGS